MVGMNKNSKYSTLFGKRKVTFATPLVTNVYEIPGKNEEDRTSPWTQYACDRDRFQRRIEHVGRTLNAMLLLRKYGGKDVV